jgi:hypothetical protein
MEIRLAERMIAEWATANTDSIGVGSKKILESYIYNPGGFGNLSIRLTKGRTQLHVKLAPPSNAARLRQWARVSDYLAEHYAAPRRLTRRSCRGIRTASFSNISRMQPRLRKLGIPRPYDWCHGDRREAPSRRSTSRNAN